MTIAREIFRAYDVRGVVGAGLDEEAMRAIGRALATFARTQPQPGPRPVFALGRDGRASSVALAEALAEGLLCAGADVIELGLVPTPLAYFAAHHLGCANAAMVTGSHNPPEYNGVKMVVAGRTLSGDEIQALRHHIEAGELAVGEGRRSRAELGAAYQSRILSDVRLARPLHVVLDCGNGAAGPIAPALYRALGCTVDALYDTVDGRFPNHHPDPSKPENLVALAAAVRDAGAELGLAFDGDADRLGVLTRSGRIVWPDRQLMLYARDVLARHPGAPIVYDVKCSRLLAPWIEAHGGRPVLWKTGHSLIKAKLAETGAPLAGEMSGHIFFGDRWYGFDDAIYCGARLLEIVSREADGSALLEALPDAPATPELHWRLAEGEPQALVAQLQAALPFPGASRVLTLDGVRVEYADGFGLARASNTTPVVVFRFEGDTPEALARIQCEFRAAIAALRPGARLPF